MGYGVAFIITSM